MKKTGLLACAVMTALVSACLHLEGGRAAAQSGSRVLPRASYEQRLWAWLQNARYRNWAPAPGQNGGFYEGQSPHGAYLKMYLNRPAAANPANPPRGSIIIKENYGPDSKTLMAVTVMVRSDGYDPEHNDWYWVKYNPDGSVAQTPPDKGGKPIAGRFPSCIQCHAGADGNDYLFVND